MLKSLPKTELLYPSPKPIDELNLVDAFHLMLNDQSMALQALEESSSSIINTVNEVYLHLSKKSLGRIIYCGAGTSGRIAVQDGVELYPTFGWPKKRIKFLIAGGNKAILNSVENAEDNINEARVKVDRLSINKNDIVIGLAASGNTAFTNEVLKLSNEKKILTIAISNNPRGSILKNAKLNIILDTKEEVVAGSTRLKAGTAQKICLNIISTLVMTKLGKVKKGMMVEMISNNKKLSKRKLLIAKYMKKKFI